MAQDFKYTKILVSARIFQGHFLEVGEGPIMNTSLFFFFFELGKALSLKNSACWVNPFLHLHHLQILLSYVSTLIFFYFLIGFRKGRRTRDQIANICWIIEKAREFQEDIYFCFIYYTKAFDCVDHNKLGKVLKEMGIPDHLTHCLKNLYAGQEATVRIGHGTTDWFQIRKGVC